MGDVCKRISHMRFLQTAILVLILVPLKICQADDILGCGGFLRSLVDIEYSKVQVKLYTKQGSLKYQTDCAPNNGYYFMPVYDKGEYIIRIDPPDGWSFEPQEVALSIDGKTDACSLGRDVDFSFRGFGITGQVVSLGSADGPAGVTVTLSTGGGQASSQVTTGPDGRFTFSPVPAGDYQVTASHAVWKFARDRTKVSVRGDNGDVGTQLAIAGYDISGQVVSGSEPVSGVTFVLHGTVVPAAPVSGCDASPAPGYTARAGLPPALCRALSDDQGRFRFPVVPSGEYTVVPFYAGAETRFDVRPAEVALRVDHDSATIAQPFQVAGFTIRGRVLVRADTGLGGATVLLDGRQVAVTDHEGAYVVESVQSGQYRLTVHAESVQFESRSVMVAPSSPVLPDAVAASFRVCGKVDLDKLPEGVAPGPRSVEFKLAGSETAYTVVTELDGAFCIFLRPASYRLRVVVSEDDRKRGLSFGSAQQELAVSAPVGGVTFSPFRARVSGAVRCLRPCAALTLTLSGDGISPRRTVAQEDGSFSFEDVLPGQYTVTAVRDEWCWKSASMPITVAASDVSDVQLTQTGYQLTVTATHATALQYRLSGEKQAASTADIAAGVNKLCVPAPGLYTLTPSGCHQFTEHEYEADTSAPAPVHLTAASHRVSGVVRTEEPSTDVKMKLTLDGETRDVAVIPSKDKKSHRFSVMAKPEQTVEFEPSSGTLLFSPPVHQLSAADDCLPDAVLFDAKKGAFIRGRVVPALAGVDVTVSAAGMEDVLTVTDTAGKYQVGPLDPKRQYSVVADKEGYVFTPAAGRDTDFEARKLAELRVRVTDEAGQPLPAVLVSVSGGRDYRRNSLTDKEGRQVFLSLSPGQYFIRPMMKEYEFTPVSKMAEIEEGAALDVTVTGKRVAYSLLGRVSSLTGEPEAGVEVEAVSEDCQHHQEEATSEQGGALRIRGLKPKCQYSVRMKSGPDANAPFSRGIPSTQTVQVSDGDVTDFRLVAFRRIGEMDMTVRVLAAAEHLSSLRLLIEPENSETPVHSIALGSSPFVVVPTALPRDGRTYTARLETTLSSNTHTLRHAEVTFEADVPARHLTLEFVAERRGADTELGAGPVLGLPLTLLAVLLAFNQKKCVDIARRLKEKYSARAGAVTPPGRRESAGPAGDGGGVIVRPVTVKVKSRKI